MGDRARRDNPKVVNNPLLFAAGSGFPFENFSENPLLVPVSQADPVLPDDIEADSFIGQEPQTSATGLPRVPNISVPKLFSPLNNQQQNAPSSSFHLIGTTSIDSSRTSPGVQNIPLKPPSPPAQQTDGSITVVKDLPQAIPAPHSLETVGLSSGGPPAHSFAQPAAQTSFPAPVAPFQLTIPPQQEVHIPDRPPQSTPLYTGINTFRLGHQKRPVYAQPPGLSWSPVSAPPVTTNTSPLPPFTQSVTHSAQIFQPIHIHEKMATPNEPQPVAASVGSVQYQSPITNGSGAPTVSPQSFTGQMNAGSVYRQVYHHWFFKKEVETKVVWKPFSMADSLALEEAFTSSDLSPETVVSTDGGRYDVNILRRQKMAVYWEENPTEVRRCSWFSKGSLDSRYIPYDENVSARLEEEYKLATVTNSWHHRVELSNGEHIIFHGPNVMVQFPQATSPDAWGNTPQIPTKPRIVKRGVDEFEIDEGEPDRIDHLLFLVHGIGSVCDLRFRPVEEVVDDFRCIALQLLQSHFKSSSEQGIVNRIEIIPVSWHSSLHSEDTGIDRKLKSITLPSIPKLRNFTNDTILDVLFYTSPVYCQTIMDTVGKELNRLYDLFQERNPNFKGGVSVGGHSLGTVILFDLLCNQKDRSGKNTEEPNSESREGSEDRNCGTEGQGNSTPAAEPNHSLLQRRLSRRISYVMGNAGTGQPYISYPHLQFTPTAFFALGSPIGMFVTVRGIDALGEDFHFPTCPAFFNIFHPFDPVAYRIETLINPEFENQKPVLVPHHKGRKRMHLELKETVSRMGADLKQMLLDSVRSTWNTVYQLAMFHKNDDKALEQEMNKVLEEEMKKKETETSQAADAEAANLCIGRLNGGRRVDYVLQEAPFESINEYIFAMGSHVCYWESEDTILMILKEIYATMGVPPDSHSIQQNIPIDREPKTNTDPDIYNELSYFDGPEPPTGSASSASGTSTSFSTPNPSHPGGLQLQVSSHPIYPSTQQNEPERTVGMDPTAPLTENKNLGPPPISGFVRK
ncbi:phospholipase DDHD2 isoform X1 [Schistocerca gregaria]|uniref:phospholipase DDHD2 isoform X1 n=2 Tax=Schistocerca gregaria TaxID=7010 RepID=UPI00211E9005|nr:phospholipase DDHD2 isoform X1 [Schistocerca gregaria]